MSAKKVYAWIAFMIVISIGLMFVLPAVATEFIAAGIASYDYNTKVFIENKVTDVNIEIDENDWQELLENPLEETFYAADVTVGGTTVYNAAVRTKGNSSLTQVANSESDRYSLKIDFGQYEDAQTLYGLEKLNLNNQMSDTSSMKEYLSYELMEEMGLPTPAHSYMYVYVNGEEFGLFLGVEQIDETFLENNFEDSTGDLYKPDGSSLEWVDSDINSYSNLYLKTNEESSDQSAIINFLDVINNGGDLSSVMDIDEVLRYFAVSTALVNLDSYQGNMRHNYYLYEQDGVFSIIPWDYNMSFGGFMGGGGGRGQMPDMNDGGVPDMGEGEMTGFGQRPSIGDGEMPDPGQRPGIGDGDIPDPGQRPDMGEGEMPDPGQRPDMGEGENTEGDIGGMGGGNFMTGGSIVSQSSIDFTIDTPVSGVTVENSPLLNCWLSNGEYKELYHSYLEEIANGFLSEARMTVMVGEIASVISSYVERDPTAFYTYDQFEAAISGDESLITFAKLRSDSILQQLSGEKESTADTSAQETMNAQNAQDAAGNEAAANDGSANANNFQPPGGGNNANASDPNQNADGNADNTIQGDENFAPPNMDGGNSPPNAKGDMGNRGNMEGMAGRGENVGSGNAINSGTALITGISGLLLLLAIGFAVFFKRRGWKRKMSFQPASI